MLFNSYIFILLFLPLCLVGYFGLNKLAHYNLAQLFLLGMSLWFYGYFNPRYLLVIMSSVLINYGAYLLLNRTLKAEILPPPLSKKIILFIALCFNVGILLYFKYMNFFIYTANSVLRTDWATLNIVLPLGISFFTFQQISFIVDAYHGEVPQYNFLYYASFVTFFPQLIAGPIVTHDELVPQFMDKQKKSLNWDNLASGIYLFAFGLAKKVLLADTFGNAANIGFSCIEDLNTTNAIIVMLSYTIQIYFDFSGYCDMAVGIGKMMNIDLPLNFNSPYKALTITEFWDRWHMTLTRFFTKYIYIPLGGSRRGTVRTYVNILVVFIVSGFWHGAGWNYIFWGVCHGVFSVLTRHFKTFISKIHPALQWIITFGFVNIAWVFFRAPSFHSALQFVNRLLLLDFGPISKDISECFRLEEIVLLLGGIPIESRYPYFIMAVIFAIAFIIILGARSSYERMQNYKPSLLNLCAITLLMAWCIFSFAGVSTFLYFNF